MAEFELNIVTPTETVFSGNVISLVAPGGQGFLGVLAHHAPLVTTLVAGRLLVRLEHEEITFEVGKGVMEVYGNKAVVLVNSAARNT